MSRQSLLALPVTLGELESSLWEAAILRGCPVDRTDWKSYLLSLLFFKRIRDVWDDDYATANDSLFIPLYVKRNAATSGEHSEEATALARVWATWEKSGRTFWSEIDAVVDVLES